MNRYCPLNFRHKVGARLEKKVEGALYEEKGL